MTIKFYKVKEPHGYMSNFYKANIFLDGKWWQSTEHYYQAMKTNDPLEQEAVRQAKSPREARDLGQKVTYDSQFDSRKDAVMKKCVLAKFVQHADLRSYLLATNDEELIEDSPVDFYWGCGSDDSGKNMLGKLLMEVRSELRNG